MIACVFTFKPAFEGHKNMCTKGTIMHLINGSLSLDGWLLTCYIWYISLDRCVSASCQIELPALMSWLNASSVALYKVIEDEHSVTDIAG